MRYLSPLRYPGGKGLLGTFIGSLISRCRPRPAQYVEPFAGGFGVGLRLLFDEYVDSVVLNDLNDEVAAFWRIALHETDALIDFVMSVDVSMESWHHYRAVYSSPASSDTERAFATFFLNRTNRSGILDARPIGGLRQDGKWRLDARFNRADLAKRIETISRYRNRIEVRCLDGTALLMDIRDMWSNTFIYADPPYLSKGDDLYLNNMSWQDHLALASCLKSNPYHWLITYDADDRVPSVLYPSSRCAEYGIAHTAASQHMGREYAIFSDSTPVNEMTGVGSGSARWLR